MHDRPCSAQNLQNPRNASSAPFPSLPVTTLGTCNTHMSLHNSTQIFLIMPVLFTCPGVSQACYEHIHTGILDIHVYVC